MARKVFQVLLAAALLTQLGLGALANDGPSAGCDCNPCRCSTPCPCGQ